MNWVVKKRKKSVAYYSKYSILQQCILLSFSGFHIMILVTNVDGFRNADIADEPLYPTV